MGPAPLWLLLAVSLAGTRGDVRRMLADGRFVEAFGVCRSELAVHPGRGWAERCVVEATAARVAEHERLALAAADREALDAALAELAAAERVVWQAASSGVAVASPTRTERELRQRAAEPSLAVATTAEGEARWGDAAVALRAALAMLAPADHAPVEARRTQALRHAARTATGRARAEGFEELAARTGAAEDRAEAARAWRALAEEAEARGAVREAVEALARAVVHDPTLGDELARVERLARTDLVLRVSGPDSDAASGLREGVEAALRRRGSRFVRVLTRGGGLRTVPGAEGPETVEAARLVVRAGRPVVSRGEPATRKVTRPAGAVTKVVQEGSLVVEVALDVEAVLEVGGRTERVFLTEQAAETARWDGRVKSVRTPVGTQKLKGTARSGERASAVQAAEEHATSAVITRLAAALAAEVLRQVDRPDPRPPPATGTAP